MNSKKMFSKSFTLAFGVAPLMCALVLAACGDDSTSAKDKDPSAASIDEVETKDKLPKCNSWREGVRYYVADEDADYLCEGNKWKNLNADDEDSDDDSSDDGSKDSEKDDAEKSSSSTKKSSSSMKDDSSDSGNSSSSVKGDSSDDGESDGKSSTSAKYSSSVKDAKSSSSENPSSSNSDDEDGKGDSFSSSEVSCSSEESSSSIASSSSSEKGTSDIDDSSVYDSSTNTLTDNRDGQTYKTVTIGTQTWMAENLNYAYTGVKFYEGVSYEDDFIKGGSYEDDSTSWCYNGEKSNCDTYGRLYTWSAAMDSAAQFTENEGTKCGYGVTCTPNTPHRGICPEGWHVPTNEEYTTLYTAVGGTVNAGIYLKSTDKWSSYKSDTEGIDMYGFSVLPAGYRYFDHVFSSAGGQAFLWSASEIDSYGAYYQFFCYGCAYVKQVDDYADADHKDSGFSLRCLKD